MSIDTCSTAWAATSPAIDQVAAALAAAGAQLDDVRRDRTADAGTYQYRYADLAAAMTSTRPVLAGHGLFITQTAEVAGDVVLVHTTILHASGQFLTARPTQLPVGRTAQATGSAITYARRYALMAILGLATEDDDGAAASSYRRTPEPTGRDWAALGWDDQAEHDHERERVRATLGALPAEQRSALRARWEELGLHWPLSRTQLDDWEREVAPYLEAASPAAPTDARKPVDKLLAAAVRAGIEPGTIAQYAASVLDRPVGQVTDLTDHELDVVRLALTAQESEGS